MTGATWRARLRYLFMMDSVSAGRGLYLDAADAKTRDNRPVHNIVLAGADSARIVNLSLTKWWQSAVGHMPNLNPTGTDYENTRISGDYFVLSMRRMKQETDRLGLKVPLVVVAAGNDGLDAFWGAIVGSLNEPSAQDVRPFVLVVGGANHPNSQTFNLWGNGSVAGASSNSGDLVDLVAPAEDVWGLVGANGGAKGSGTSYAAPQAAAVAALALAMDSTLDGSQLRKLLVDGAIAGGRTVSNYNGTLKSTLPVLDAYATLKLVAAKKGTPMCGNRVWIDSTKLHIMRDTADEQIALPPGFGYPLDLQPRHGGRYLGVRALLPGGTYDTWNLVGGVWVRSSQIPVGTGNSLAGAWYSTGKLLDLFQYYPGGWDGNGWFGATHNGDTLVFADISINPSTFAASLDVTRSVGGTRTPVGGTRAVTASQPAGSAPVVMTDLSQLGQGKETLMSDVRVVSQPRVAVSPAGRYAYVAWNTTRGGMLEPDQAFFSNCVYGQSSVFPCRGGWMSSWSDGARVERLDLQTGQFDSVIVNDPVRNIMWLSVSEDGREIVYATVRDSSRQRVATNSYYLYDFSLWQAYSVPLQGIVNIAPCALVFRSLVRANDSTVVTSSSACRDQVSFQQLGSMGLRIASDPALHQSRHGPTPPRRVAPPR